MSVLSVLVRRYRNLRNPANLKTVLGGFLALIAYFGILLMDPAVYGLPNLTAVEVRVVAIFLTAAILWLSEAIPTWCTSVLIIVVMLLTVSDSSLWLAIAVEKVGLEVFMAKALLKPFGSRPSSVLAGFILVTALFSAFISNTAMAAMMLAFLAPVLRSLPGNSKGKIALAMAIPLGANIGGIATPIGTPPNGVAMKYLNDPGTLDMLREAGQEAHEVTFGQWCTAMIPVTLITLFIGWVVLQIMFPFQKGERIEIKIQGGLRKGYKTWMVAITFALTIILWFTGEWNHLNANVVALVPICCLCLTGILHKRDLEKINWSVLWMVAGGFALGLGFNKSGLAHDLVTSIPFGSWSPLVVLIIAGIICWTLSNFISNSATAALLIPILCAVGVGMGDKLLEIGGLRCLLFGTAMAASLAMTLPISTPPNAIASSTGIINTSDMAKSGLTIGILGGIVGYLLLIFLG